MQLKAVVHSFSKQLEYSVTLSDEPSWVAFYQGIFPNMISAQRIDQDGPLQRQGVDRIITLDSGKQILIDEKKRTKDYGDLLLEALSVCTFDWETRQVDFEKMTKPGWAVDPAKTCDYIAYAIPSSGKCFLLPYSLLRETCNTFFKEWDTNPRYYPKPAKNNGYTTVSFAIPFDVFLWAMGQTMQRQFGSVLALPAPQDNGIQQVLTFDLAAQS